MSVATFNTVASFAAVASVTTVTACPGIGMAMRTRMITASVSTSMSVIAALTGTCGYRLSRTDGYRCAAGIGSGGRCSSAKDAFEPAQEPTAALGRMNRHLGGLH